MAIIPVVLGLAGAFLISMIFFIAAGVLDGVHSPSGYVLGLLVGAIFGIIARDWNIVR